MILEAILSSKTTSTEKVVRGETPKYPAVIKKLLEAMPVNSTIIFYDGSRKYDSGRMPYFSVRKEFNNAIQKMAYRQSDNRGQTILSPEDNMEKLVDAIYKQSNPSAGGSFLNTYILQYNRNAAQQSAPAAITPEEKPDMNNLKRIRQIKIAKARKHLPKDTQ